MQYDGAAVDALAPKTPGIDRAAQAATMILSGECA
jgi:hypothetical protein